MPLRPGLQFTLAVVGVSRYCQIRVSAIPERFIMANPLVVRLIDWVCFYVLPAGLFIVVSLTVKKHLNFSQKYFSIIFQGIV